MSVEWVLQTLTPNFLHLRLALPFFFLLNVFVIHFGLLWVSLRQETKQENYYN